MEQYQVVEKATFRLTYMLITIAVLTYMLTSMGGCMNIDNEIIEAKKYYKLLNDKDYLLNCDVEKETYKTVCEKFISSPCSKTDFVVLIFLIEGYLDWSLQSISFKYEYLELTLGLKKQAISRSIKSLIENGFISKFPVDNTKIQQYFFRTQYEVMKDRV